MSPNQLEALRLLGEYTGGFFTFRRLTGPGNAERRAHILTALTGSKVVKSKAGITALEKAIYAFADIPRGCSASMEHSLENWAKTQLGIIQPKHTLDVPLNVDDLVIVDISGQYEFAQVSYVGQDRIYATIETQSGRHLGGPLDGRKLRLDWATLELEPAKDFMPGYASAVEHFAI